jgi:hypothetical protein
MNKLIYLCAALTLGTAVAGEAPNPEPATQPVANAVAEAPAAAEPSAAAAEEEAQLQLRQTLRQMRTLFEQEDAQTEAMARGYTQSLQASSDMPGLGAMREQLSRQLERLEERCFGMDAKVNGGNLIVICGDNAGTAENANINSGNRSTTVIVPPAPPPAQEEDAP